MTGDPDGHEDILGFGDTDRAPRTLRLAIRLDRLTLRLTRRPRLVAAAATLVVVALVAGGTFTYLGPTHSIAPSSAVQPRMFSELCSVNIQSKVASAAMARLLKQLQSQATSTSSAYSSRITIHVTQADAPSEFTVIPGTAKITCP